MLLKIAHYADERAGPHGVVPMRERLENMLARYPHLYPDANENDRLCGALEKIERDLFSGLSIRPEDITDTSIAATLAQLSSFEI